MEAQQLEINIMYLSPDHLQVNLNTMSQCPNLPRKWQYFKARESKKLDVV